MYLSFILSLYMKFPYVHILCYIWILILAIYVLYALLYTIVVVLFIKHKLEGKLLSDLMYKEEYKGLILLLLYCNPIIS